MKASRSIEILFLIAALYDGGLGAAFLLVPGLVFRMGNVTPPNHWAYVQFPAALLLIFAMMFVAIARNPIKNKDLVIYGFLLKLSYCGVVFGYWLTEGIPDLWKPFAVIDLVTAALFVWSYKVIGTLSHQGK
jgi:hypothetical protein